MKRYAPCVALALIALTGCGPATTQVKDAAPPPQAVQEEAKQPERIGVKGFETKPPATKPTVLRKPDKKRRDAQPAPVTEAKAEQAVAPAPVAKVEKVEPAPTPAAKVEPPPAPVPPVKRETPPPAPPVAAKVEPPPTPVAKVEPTPAPVAKAEPTPVPKAKPPPAPVAKVEPIPAPAVSAKVEPPPTPAPVPAPVAVPAKSSREYLMEARSEHMAGRNRQALEAVVKAREGFPQEIEPELLEAKIRYEMDDAEGGLKLLEGMVARGEGGEEALDTYVTWTERKGLAARAITHLEALKSASTSPDPNLVGPLGWLYYRTGNAKAALENFDLLENTPAYSKWAVFAARLRLQNSDTARAKSSAAAATVGRVQARSLMAEAEAVEGHVAEAEGVLKTQLPGDAGGYEATLGLGLLRLNQGDAKGAATLFQTAADREPGRPEAYNNLGVARRALTDEAGAEEAFAKALAASPDYPPALKNLAILKEKFQGDYAAAVKLYTRYLEKLPGDKEVERYLKAATRSAEEAKAAQEPAAPAQEGSARPKEGTAPAAEPAAPAKEAR